MARPESRGGGALRWFHLAIATGAGAGRSPIAPGTAGAAIGLAASAILTTTAGPPAALTGALLVTALGFFSAGAAARTIGEPDPGRVVIDEVAGQMIALLFLPPTVPVWIAAFLLFRILDIVKPFPARRLEDLPGSSGIMTDDLVAGLYANGILQLARWLLAR